MKKIVILVIILIVFLIFSKDQDNLVMVNKLDNIDDNMAVVYFYIPNLSTKNIINYFDDNSNIIGLYPYVNPIYKKKTGDMFYGFNNQSLKKNINNFIKIYKTKLINNNFNSDAIMIEYNGIKIEAVKAYMNKKDIKSFLKKCKNCNYSLTK